ncbi:MAG: hypothetical protein R3D35_00615 [Nitratireductor sp.]
MRAAFNDIKDVLEALSYLGVIIGLVFAAFEYNAAKELQNEKNAIEFIRDFQAEEISEARLWLERQWRPYPLREISGKTGSAEVIDQLAMSFTIESTGGTGTDNFIRVVDFLDVVGTCVETGICNKTIITRHLGDFTENLLCLYQAPLKVLRGERGLETLGGKLSFLTDGKVICTGGRAP